MTLYHNLCIFHTLYRYRVLLCRTVYDIDHNLLCRSRNKRSIHGNYNVCIEFERERADSICCTFYRVYCLHIFILKKKKNIHFKRQS